MSRTELSTETRARSLILMFYAPAILFSLAYIACQIWYIVYASSAAWTSDYASEGDVCKSYMDTALAGCVTTMVCSLGIIPGVVLVLFILRTKFPNFAESEFYITGDPTRPSTPPAEEVVIADSQGVRVVKVRPPRPLSEKERFSKRKKMMKRQAKKAEQNMLSMFTDMDVKDQHRVLSLREAKLIKTRATDKEWRASADALLQRYNLHAEEKALQKKIEAAQAARLRGTKLDASLAQMEQQQAQDEFVPVNMDGSDTASVMSGSTALTGRPQPPLRRGAAQRAQDLAATAEAQ